MTPREIEKKMTPRCPKRCEVELLYTAREAFIESIKAKGLIDLNDLAGLDRSGKCFVAAELWGICIKSVRGALLVDEHPQVRSVAAISQREFDDACPLSDAEVEADRLAQEATSAHIEFRYANEQYFELSGKLNPETGRPLVEPRPDLENELERLSTVAREMQKRALQVEYEVRSQRMKSVISEFVRDAASVG
jgi:hypothetical protein